MDAGCRVECCFYRVELLEACLCCMALECCREPYDWILPCRMLGDMGNSCWRMPCSDLHGMSLVVVVFLGEELILYIELIVETWSCWIACGNTVGMLDFV